MISMKYKYIIAFVVLLIALLVFRSLNNSEAKTLPDKKLSLSKDYLEEDVETIYLVGGCFGVMKATKD